MKNREMDRILRQTLEDHHLSRGEKRALTGLLEDDPPDRNERANLRNRAFEMASQALSGSENLRILEWLQDVVKVIEASAAPGGRKIVSRAFFTPGDDCPAQIVRLFARALREVQVCVFTITDDRIASAILEAHGRGVSIRIITDDDKAFDPGSDVGRLAEAGVPLRFDGSEAHMHHKFALFDQETLLTGSYNWTRGAARRNQDNFIVTGRPNLVSAFSETFEALWEQFA